MKHTNHLIVKALILFIILFVINIWLPISAQDISTKIDEFVSLYHDKLDFNGSVLVAKKGKVVFKKGYGMANRENNIKNETETKFRIGSITKSFTAILIMQLVEQKRIDLHGKLIKYLPYYRKDNGNKVTIHHLLNHSSGIPSYTSNTKLADINLNPYPVNDFIKDFCSDDLLFEPGTDYQYNNTGYFILGGIIEAVCGKPYEEVLKDNLLEKAGMKNTGYDHGWKLLSNWAIGYNVKSGDYSLSRKLNMSIPYSAGALYSTVEDLFLLDEAIYLGKLLSEDMMEIMFKPGIGGSAYGWFIDKTVIPGSDKISNVISHAGKINGYNALIKRLVDEKILIVVFCNSPKAELGRMTSEIYNILHGVPASFKIPKSIY